jgi:zinc finger CCHC domain-containing protein 9
LIATNIVPAMMTGSTTTTCTATKTTSTSTNKSKGKFRPNKKGVVKPKLTKEDRRAKYTLLARERESQKRRKLQTSHLICYQCRQKGHAVADCPNNNSTTTNNKNKNVPTRLCFQCGSTEHSLSSCPKRQKLSHGEEEELPFCHCFICNQKGHLSSKCPQNNHGIYVNGGGECKTCGSNLHTSKACPEATNNTTKKMKKEVSSSLPNMDPDTLLHGQGDDLAGMEEEELSRTTIRKDKTPDTQQRKQRNTKKRRVVNF